MAPRFIARQLSHPSGFAGAIIMFLMNRSNARLNTFALEKLAASSHDRVLEIGFGGGLALPKLIARAALVSGVDRSDKAVSDAKARFAREMGQGRADFRLGQVEALPFEAATFDKVLSVNTIYFWRSLDEGFAEIARVLAPGGRVVIGFLPKEFMDKMNMPADIFAPRAPEQVIAAMAAAGLRDARAEKPSPAAKWQVATATKP